MRAHEAGALHGDLGFSGPSWLRTPENVNALVPQLWAKTVERATNGEISVGGVNVRKIAEDHGTPAYVFDEADFRARCKAFKEAFGGAEVFYAGKAFIATAIVRILVEEGLSLDVCTGGELAVALRGGMPPSGSACTATTSRSPSSPGPSRRAWAGSSSTRSTRSTG